MTQRKCTECGGSGSSATQARCPGCEGSGRELDPNDPARTGITKPKRFPRTASNHRMPDGREFVWGPVDKLHVIGKYTIVEYRRDCSNMIQSEYWPEHGTVCFHPYIEDRDTNHSCSSLEEAIVLAIAIDRDGLNTRAHTYFMKATS